MYWLLRQKKIVNEHNFDQQIFEFYRRKMANDEAATKNDRIVIQNTNEKQCAEILLMTLSMIKMLFYIQKFNAYFSTWFFGKHKWCFVWVTKTPLNEALKYRFLVKNMFSKKNIWICRTKSDKWSFYQKNVCETLRPG